MHPIYVYIYSKNHFSLSQKITGSFNLLCGCLLYCIKNNNKLSVDIVNGYIAGFSLDITQSAIFVDLWSCGIRQIQYILCGR